VTAAPPPTKKLAVRRKPIKLPPPDADPISRLNVLCFQLFKQPPTIVFRPGPPPYEVHVVVPRESPTTLAVGPFAGVKKQEAKREAAKMALETIMKEEGLEDTA
jgi:hypothetical protein